MDYIWLILGGIAVVLTIRFVFNLGRAIEQRIPTPQTHQNSYERYRVFARTCPENYYDDVAEYICSRSPAQLADIATALEGSANAIDRTGIDNRPLLFDHLRETQHAPRPQVEEAFKKMSSAELRALVFAIRSL